MESTSKLKRKHQESGEACLTANSKKLAQIDGEEVSVTNLQGGSGPEFRFQLQLSSSPEASGSSGTSRKGKAKLRFVYFPITKGEENTDRIIKKLNETGSGNECFTCVSVSHRGCLLPNACWARLPFMEPKLKTGDEAYRLKRCYSRVICFIETDECFILSSCKTDLLDEDLYTKALKSFGAQYPCNGQGLQVQIVKEGEILSLADLEMTYKTWVSNMHVNFDEEVDFNVDQDTVAFEIDSSSKKLFGINANAARICKKVRRNGQVWQRGQHLRILKGASAKFQKTNTYAVIEYILVEGFSGAICGEAQFICRKRDTPEDMGCLLTKNSDKGYIIDVRDSLMLPLTAIDSGKI